MKKVKLLIVAISIVTILNVTSVSKNVIVATNVTTPIHIMIDPPTV